MVIMQWQLCIVFVKAPPGVTQTRAWRILNRPGGSLSRSHFSWPLWLPVQTRTRWLGPFVLSLAPADRCAQSLALGLHRAARRKRSSRQRAAQSRGSPDDHKLPSAKPYLFFSIAWFLLFVLLFFALSASLSFFSLFSLSSFVWPGAHLSF